MKKQRKSILVLAIIVAFVGLGLFLPGLIGAGDLEPTDPPDSTMYTLEDIYNIVLDTNTKVTPEPCTGSPVAKTGQSVSYEAGDDGDWEKGLAWPDPRFTDNGDGTVTDNLTGLIWLKNASCFVQKTWANALGDCNGLADGACGLTDGSSAGDWRMSNVKELQSLFDYSEYNPAIPSGHPFTGVQSNTYWSSTTYAGNTDEAIAVYMNNGFVLSYAKLSYTFSPWPVRGGN